MKVRQIQDCAACDSEKLEFVPQNGKPHHGKLVCGKCGRFITWTAKDISKFLFRFDTTVERKL